MATEPAKPIERLADALQACFKRASEEGARNIEQSMKAQMAKQDETLRLIWKQVKGNGKLPIDD